MRTKEITNMNNTIAINIEKCPITDEFTLTLGNMEVTLATQEEVLAYIAKHMTTTLR
jgi:hypothetical protein